MKQKVSICWLRRDLRLDDNTALYQALQSGVPVLPIFVFDTDILSRLGDKSDKRVVFIYRALQHIQSQLIEMGSTLCVKIGQPAIVWQELINTYDIQSVYTNHDYEPYGMQRDQEIAALLTANSISFHTYKDQVILERAEVTKDDGLPYTVFTPYSKKWRALLTPAHYKSYPTLDLSANFLQMEALTMPSMAQIGFEEMEVDFPAQVVKSDIVKHYSETRDIPAIAGTSRMGVHLRFGTVSIRKLLTFALARNQTYVNELIWREFYQQILWHFPHVVQGAFRPAYDQITWLNNEQDFDKWCQGMTGIAMVDAGMRELNATGHMHNRVRMIVASFLTKHLLIDWRWGEAYFAQKLLDFDLASNNGGWQWAAGSGTDAAPYFRVFNPVSQMMRFDPELVYVKRWVPEYGTASYPAPMVDLAEARDRCLTTYKSALKKP
jgi:deoxyribodipyrimidine photo-lyase